MQIDAAAELRIYWSINNQLALNVVGARVNGAVTFDQALANVLGAAIKSGFGTALTGLMAPSTSLMTVGVRDLRTDNQAEFRDDGAPVVGTGTGDAMPAGDAVCVTNRTALSGKSFTGRTYISGWDELQNSAGGTTSIGAANGAVSFMNVIAGALAGNGMSLAVLSRPSEQKIIQEITTHADGTTTIRTISRVTAKTGTATPVVSSESRNAFWESQRRRDNGRGAAPTTLLARTKILHDQPATQPTGRSATGDAGGSSQRRASGTGSGPLR